MSRAIAIRLCACAFMLAGCWVAMTQQAAAPLTLEKVAGDDLYNISGSGGNAAFYVTDQGVILVDDKFPQNVREILDKIKSVTDKPVRYIVNTHQHPDHTGGNEQLLAAAEIFAHENARLNMAAKDQPGLQRVTFRDELQLHLGGKEVRAKHFGRGHTNGDSVIYFPALKTIHTGDLFVRGAPFIDYSSGGSAIEWTKTLDEVLRMDFQTVIPGHGQISNRDDLLAFRKAFETMRSRMSELRREGKTPQEAAKLLRIDDLGWKQGPLFERSMPGLYDEVR
jgi:glyoxylase-like metal-dependent hydrolase (beta-lactamase superfamily II)